ncbi:MAG: iron-sulfur cluster assembly scaffold protein [Spirochaetes bacterium]|nr:iron-sulfur cluster assembly scaffold protein [Spirochaetota bacterium]
MQTYSDELLRLAETTPIKIPVGVIVSEHANKLCGDRIAVAPAIIGNHIREIRWRVEGCAILKASAAFMARTLKEQSLNAAYVAIERFEKSFDEENDLRQSALAPIYRLPARYKCALLPWLALKDFLREHT